MRLRSQAAVQPAATAPPAANPDFNTLSRFKSAGSLSLSLLVMLASCSGPQSRLLPDPPPGPVRGFQIQIHTTLEKDAAESVVLLAENWWQELEQEEKRLLYGAMHLPVEIKWLQPYYRVRLGRFRSREEARNILNEVAEAFPAAFIVPDTIQ